MIINFKHSISFIDPNSWYQNHSRESQHKLIHHNQKAHGNLKILISNIALYTKSRVSTNSLPSLLHPLQHKLKKEWRKRRKTHEGKIQSWRIRFHFTIFLYYILLNKQVSRVLHLCKHRGQNGTPCKGSIDPSRFIGRIEEEEKKKERGWIVKETNEKRRKQAEGGGCIEGRRTVNLAPGHGDPFLKDYRYKLYISRVGRPVHPGRHFVGWPVAA